MIAAVALKSHIDTYFAYIPQDTIIYIQPWLKKAFETDSSSKVRN
jgi:hypothetical protein